MKIEVPAGEVRRLVIETFEVLGAESGNLFNLQENILVHEGCYAARSYHTDELLAMWLIEAGLVQFYDAQGNMLRTINLFEELEPVKLAA